MNPQSSSRSERTLFTEALGKATPGERAAFLDGACGGDAALRGRVEALLRNHIDADSFLAQPAVEMTTETAPAPLSEGPGTLIGRYKLLQVIGEGGMGSVFMAEQLEPVSRKVALKIIKLGMDTRQVVARFEAERQALAMMDHPNIAKVFDAGATETGRPYFVMELVKGVPIHEFCDKNQLSPRERLELFIPVCHAIQHAHQKGVIHRDIKPSNVMVTLHDGQPVPKVIDFGIAKATHQKLTEKTLFTNYAQMIGTPAYMSPEQAELSGLDVDTRTDVYSLGVLLYELLTGTTPFSTKKLMGAGYAEMQRIIREEEPERPSTRLSTLGGNLDAVVRHRKTNATALSQELSGDLDWIVMKALDKDRARRYDSANGLAQDIQRHLQSEPVVAAPPSRRYQLQKFVDRHRAGVRIATVVGIIIVGLLGFLIEEFVRAEKMRRVASAQAARAEKAAGEAALDAARARKAQADEARLRELANTQALAARRSGYAADMLLAQNFLADNNRGKAIKLLNGYVPASTLTNGQTSDSPDLRGWEWHYLSTATRGQELAVLRGHESSTFGIGFPPDGRWLASSGLNGAVLIWDAKTHALTQRLNVGGGDVYSLAISPDGRLLAAGGDPRQEIVFWNTTTWQRAFTLTNEYRVTALTFSPDGHFLAVAGSMGGQGLVVWDMTQRVPAASWPLPRAGSSLLLALAFSPDSRLLVYDLHPGRLGRWDTITRQQLPPIEAHETVAAISRALFAEDGTLAATTSDIGASVRVWSLPDWKLRHQLTNEFLLSLSAKEDLMVTSYNQEVHYWRLRTGEPVGRMVGHLESLTSGAISPRDGFVATTSWDRTVRLWPLKPPTPRRLVRRLSTNEVRSSSFWWQVPHVSNDGRHILTVQTNGTLSVWDGATLELIADHPWPVPELRSADIAVGGKLVAAAGEHGEVAVMEVSTGRITAQTRMGTNQVYPLRFSPDGSRLATARTQGGFPLEILETSTLGRQRIFGHDSGSVHSLAFTPDNRRLVAGFWTSTASVLDLESGHVDATMRGHQGRVTSVTITPDGRIVATAATDGTVRTWDARTGRETGLFRGAWEEYSSVALSPDGSRLAAGAAGIDVWDLVTGRQVQTLRTTNSGVLSIAWTPDMSQLATAGVAELRVWPSDTATVSPTNVLAAVLDLEEAADRSHPVLDPDWHNILPTLDKLVAIGDPSGFWRKTRATARAWVGDLAGAAEDNPAFAIPPRDPRCTAQQVDLTRYYNQTLFEDGLAGVGGDLRELPRGFQSLGSTDFDLRGIVHLGGTCPDRSNFPKEVAGLSVNRRCGKLHALHATSFEDEDGTILGRYVLHYEDGETRELPIRYGVDTRNWWTVTGESKNTTQAEIVWRGNCPRAESFGQSVRLWKRTYDNPRPGVKVVSLDFVSAMNFPAPFLVALTVE